MTGCRSTQAWLGVVVAAASTLSGCGDPPSSESAELYAPLVTKDTSVVFTDCTEFAGIGFVPAANARPLVPARYELLGDGENAIVVVRVADCDGVSVAGKNPRPGIASQVGISVTPVDETASINNYTLWFGTNVGSLHAKLRGLGVKSELDQNLAYVFAPDAANGGSLAIAASPPKGPAYSVNGTVLVPTAEPVPFIATWWADTRAGAVSMRTEFPEIRFGSATMTLTTDPGSSLADLVGDSTLTFAILDSYNAFDSARLTIDVTEF